MRRIAMLAGMVFVLAVLSTMAALADSSSASTSGKGTGSVLVGTVTAREGSQFSLKTDEGKVYIVDANNATVTLDRLPGNCMSLRVGDRVRLYGVVKGDRVCASRLHVFLSPSEAAATMMPPVVPPPAEGAGPAEIKPVPEYDGRLPAVGDNLGAWRSRGLVLGVQYKDKMMTIATSMGPYDIDASGATVIAAKSSISLARVSQGDAVRIWGNPVGLHKIRADRIEVLRGVVDQEAAVPVRNASVTGKIDYIDYPSFTFRIDTGTGEAKVMVDENTFLHFQGNTKAFMDLSVGQKVKVYGFGNLASGYVASQVQIVGDPGS